METLNKKKLYQLAQIIHQDWKNPYFGAVPYIRALGSLDSVNSMYGWDSGDSVVRYFLSNAQTWKGETARAVKAELKRRLKVSDDDSSRNDWRTPVMKRGRY